MSIVKASSLTVMRATKLVSMVMLSTSTSLTVSLILSSMLVLYFDFAVKTVSPFARAVILYLPSLPGTFSIFPTDGLEAVHYVSSGMPEAEKTFSTLIRQKKQYLLFLYLNYKLPSAYRHFAMQASTSAMGQGGSKRATTVPERSTMNLVKFHLMSELFL